MDKFQIELELQSVAAARREWDTGHRKFNADVEWIMRRLIHEAARNFMSAEDVARHGGFTPKRIRELMRAAGLDPKAGKHLLSKKAAETLASNADLMGIEPREMDLTSPLAYLPMGEQMRRELQNKSVSQVTDIPMENGEMVTGYTTLTEAVHDLHLRGGRLRYGCPACGLTGDEVSGNPA